ncbi:MAG: cytochrome b5 domain-containing protein [Patescibacteria group bacterium]
MKKMIFALVCGLMVVGAGCGSASATTPAANTNQQISPVVTPGPKTYSLSDVAAHSTANDCWMVISGKVYNVTSYIPNHPGSDRITAGCGKDATALFGSIKDGKGHSDYAKSLQTDYYLGDLK